MKLGGGGSDILHIQSILNLFGAKQFKLDLTSLEYETLCTEGQHPIHRKFIRKKMLQMVTRDSTDDT